MPILPSLTSAMEEIKHLNDQLEKTKRLYQEMVGAALQWREKYLRLEGQANALAAEALRVTNIAEKFANRNVDLEAVFKHNAEVGRAAEAQVKILQDRVRMFETSEASTISDLRSERDQLQHALNEVRKRSDENAQLVTEHAMALGRARQELQHKEDVVQSWAKTCHDLKLEIHRKDKDLSLLRSELERVRMVYADTAKEFDKVRVNFRHTATEVNEAYLRGRDAGYVQGRRDGQSERDNAAMLAGDDCPCNLPIEDIHLDHRKISGEFINRAIDLHDLLHEIAAEDPHAVKFKVSNPAMTGQIVALIHALRDLYDAPCPFNEG